MITLLLIIIAFALGMTFKTKIIEWVSQVFVKYEKNYKVKFHVYFIIHRSGSRVNEMIKTETIELTIRAESEDVALSFIKDLINNEARIEIESLEVE